MTVGTSESFVGWSQLEHVLEGCRQPRHMLRLEVYKIEITVGRDKKLMEVAQLLVEDGFKVTLNSKTHITAVRGKHDNETIEVRVRSA